MDDDVRTELSPGESADEAEGVLRRQNLHDGLVASAAEARRSLAHAVGTTLLAPAIALVEAFISLPDGWPSFGPVAMVAMMIPASVFWVRWWGHEASRRDLKEQLQALQLSRR